MGGVADGDSHLWNGNHIFPLCEQGGGESAQGLFNNADYGGVHVAAVCGARTGVSAADCWCHGLCRPSFVYRYDDGCCGDGRFPMHPVRLSALPQAPVSLRGVEAALHCAQHSVKHCLLRVSRRQRCGLCLPVQPCLHRHDNAADAAAHKAWRRFRLAVGEAYAQLFLSDTDSWYRWNP